MMLREIVSRISYLRGVVTIICILSIVITNAQSNKDELYKQRESLQNEIKFTTKLLETTSKKKGQRLNQVKLLGSKIGKREELIRNYQSEIVILERKIEDRKRSIVSLENELIKQKELYAEFIRYSYKNHNHFSTAVYLLASNNLNQFYLRKKYLEQLKEARVSKIELIQKIEEKILAEIEKLNNSKKEKTNKLAELEKEKDNLYKEKKRKESSIHELTGEENELKKQLKDKQRIEEEIKKRIEELIREEAKKSKYARLTPEQQLISEDFERNKGRLPWPTRQGVITEKFGEHWHPVIKGVKVRNSGIDITTLQGEKVRCIFSGEISKIFSVKGADFTIIVKHGSYYTVYHNLSNVSVNVGEKVTTKTNIGEVSKGKEGENSIVHFEIWKGMEKLNPENWISN